MGRRCCGGYFGLVVIERGVRRVNAGETLTLTLETIGGMLAQSVSRTGQAA